MKPADRRAVAAGSVIIAAGDRARRCTSWSRGRVGDGIVVVAHRTAVAGELFGELSFLGAIPSKSVLADSDVVVDVLSGDAVHSILDSDPVLAARFYRSLAVLVARPLKPAQDGPLRRCV